MPANQVFLLSPANCGGKRAGYLMRKGASFDLAVRLRTEGASIADIFTFMSGLYFRGKVAYSAAFAKPPAGCGGVHVIVPGRGLLDPETVIGLDDLKAIAKVPVELSSRKYLKPLREHAGELHARLGDDTAVVLLGSVATAKYLEPLGKVFGGRLRYPREFISRGDMSRGALMLRCAKAGQELTYIAPGD